MQITFTHKVRCTALATAALLACGLSQAQSTVQLYGLIDASVGEFQNAGGIKIKRLDSGNLSTSFIGFKGSEDLGGGLKAGFVLESFLLVDTGGQSRVPGVDAFWARNANVSLSGGFGTLKLGRQGPPLFVSTLIFNSFGDSFGYSPSIRQYYNATSYSTSLVGDSGWNNAIGYSTPNLGGLSANVMVASGENAATSKGPNYGANVLYFGGAFAATAAVQKVQAQGTLGRAISGFPGFLSQTAYQVGASYDLKVVKLYAQYGKIKTDANADVDVTNINLSASVPLGGGAVLLAYGNSKIDTVGVATKPVNKMITVGYDYNLSKRTDLYGIIMSDQYTGLSNGTTWAIGVRHTF